MQIKADPLCADAFAPYGDVLDAEGTPDRIINQGMCGRHHDRARLSFEDGRAGVSIFNAIPRSLPYVCDLLERHPLGSQCFVPMSSHPFLVIVARDDHNRPGAVRAFITNGAQAINFHQGVWHGVLTPLHGPGLFAVIDRIGEGSNLEEVMLDAPVTVIA
ncbi:ureidoglycolate lyase [Rhodobacteraceae bacterium]|nr:ureidoglycolate lyase [Paracoccaceae bacterium]